MRPVLGLALFASLVCAQPLLPAKPLPPPLPLPPLPTTTHSQPPGPGLPDPPLPVPGIPGPGFIPNDEVVPGLSPLELVEAALQGKVVPFYFLKPSPPLRSVCLTIMLPIDPQTSTFHSFLSPTQPHSHSAAA